GFRVVAFEANPLLVEFSKNRFKEAIQSGNLVIIEGAIAPKSAGATIEFYSNNTSVWGTIRSDWATRNATMGMPSKMIQVTRVDFAEAVHSYGMPFYLKIDLEGVDRFVLEELKSFSQLPRYLSMESDKISFADL